VIVKRHPESFLAGSKRPTQSLSENAGCGSIHLVGKSNSILDAPKDFLDERVAARAENTMVPAFHSQELPLSGREVFDCPKSTFCLKVSHNMAVTAQWLTPADPKVSFHG
jgi:hypothetical protein